MTTQITNDNIVNLEGTISAADLRLLAKNGPIGKLCRTKMPKLTARIAMGLSSLPSVDHVWLWCDVTRTAMRHVVSIPRLRVLDVLVVVKPGRLEGWQFEDAMAEQIPVGAAVVKNASGLMLSPSLRRNEMHWRRATNTF